MAGYATRDVAGVLGLSRDQIYRCVRQGLVSPARGARGEYRFAFQDIVVLRTARGLVDAHVPARRALRLLRKLRGELPQAGDLAGLRVQVRGNDVVVRDADALWAADSGQGVLDFTVGELAGTVQPLAHRAFRALEQAAGSVDSDAWYNLGLDLEDVDPTQAPEAYRRAIELDPDNADAHVNLGRLLQLAGAVDDAEAHYRAAVDAAPEHQLALYNLGTLHDERDELDTAMRYYRRAQDVPDAHYNMARIFELRGDELAAWRHLKQYQRLSG